MPHNGIETKIGLHLYNLSLVVLCMFRYIYFNLHYIAMIHTLKRSHIVYHAQSIACDSFH